MLNTVCLIGRITHDLELRSTPSGVSVIRFTIACDRSYQPKGQERQADFIDCIAWRGTAEFIAKHFCKGSLIAIEGSIQTSNYEKNGEKRKRTEVVCNNVSFCGDKGSQPKEENEPQGNRNANLNVSADDDIEEIETDDLPF